MTKTKSSELEKIASDFNGEGYFHFDFIASEEEKFIEVQFASSTVISGIVINFPSNRGVQWMKIEALEQGIQYPDQWSLFSPEV